MEENHVRKLVVTRTAGTNEKEERKPLRTTVEERVKKTTRHAWICICILCAALLLRSLDAPFAQTMRQGIATALSFDIDAEETLGRLKFVQMQMEDTVTAFAAQSVGESATRCMPVQGAVLRGFSEENDHLLLNVQSLQSVLAPAAGTVADVSDDSIAIDFSDGVSCLLTNLAYIDVKAGQQIACGEAIAAADSAGTPIAFYLWQNGAPIDPQQWVDAVQ